MKDNYGGGRIAHRIGVSLQTLVIGGLLGPPAARAGQPYCSQPHGVVVVTVEACLKVRRPEPSRRLLGMGVFTKCTLTSLSNAANPQPGDFTQERSGDRKGRGRRGYRPSMEVPL